MNLPELTPVAKSKTNVGVFLGLNETEITGDSEFYDMQNISSDMYPGITCRKKRGDVIATITKPNGLCWKNGLMYVDGTALYYGGKQVATLADSKKQLVGMGAYVCIFPDKIVYNTHDGTIQSMESSWSQSATITVAPVSSNSTFVKITSTGIGKNFNRYDAITLSGFTTNADALNVSKIIQEKGDDYIVVIAVGSNGLALSSFTQSSGVSAKRSCPDMDFVCEFNNRIWGCSSENHEIYASKLGDPFNWNAFEGISTDSYAVTVGSDGDFTGCLSHQGYVVFFKENYIHTIYGTKPSNYTMDTVQARGPAKGCEQSLCHVDESVFYASRNDICVYEGSIPESISDKLRIHYQAAVAGQFDSKYFISLQDTVGKWHLYVYDVRTSSQAGTRLWYKEDDLHMQYAVYGEGKLYLIDQDGKLRTIYGDSEESWIEWELASGYLEEGSLEKKKIHKLQFNIDLVPDAVVELYVRYDNSPQWILMKSITADERRTYSIPMKLKRAERYQFKLHGLGKFKLFGMSRIVQAGSDR